MVHDSTTERIVVYGATGFTGGLIARELKRRGAEFLIAGRDRGKLGVLSAELGGVPFVAVSVDDAAGLREMLEPCSVVIACWAVRVAWGAGGYCCCGDRDALPGHDWRARVHADGLRSLWGSGG